MSGRPVVFLFPGQSSRCREMTASCVAASATARRLLERASDAVGRNLAIELSPDSPNFLASNHSVQLAVFMATQMHLAELAEAGVRADYSAGLSLGEYSHLVDIGALDFEGALRLVDVRGTIYDAGPHGVMVSVFPVSEEAVRQVVARARTRGPVEISGFNSPSQFVLSGERDAVLWAAEQIEDSEFATAAVIENRIPMHSGMFRPVAALFRRHLEDADWKRPRKPYLPNVTGAFVHRPTRETFIERLWDHVHRPVLWRQSVEALAGLSSDATFVEVGPGRVLTNLMRRPWLSVRRLATDGDGVLGVARAVLADVGQDA